jgi:hypothetical protein
MFRMSLRELLGLVGLATLMVASLRYASYGWNTLVSAIVVIVFYIAGVFGIAKRGPQQAFALGMIFHMGCYAALLVSPIIEQWRYPSTTQLLRYLHSSIVDVRFLDRDTGQEISKERANEIAIQNRVRISVDPSDDDFMQIGHCWFALLLGYVGGRLVQYMYVRHRSEHELLAAESS